MRKFLVTLKRNQNPSYYVETQEDGDFQGWKVEQVVLEVDLPGLIKLASENLAVNASTLPVGERLEADKKPSQNKLMRLLWIDRIA